MSTSGLLAVKFIIQNIQSPRLIPVIATNASMSKSKDIRRSCCEFLDYILNNWPVSVLERHVAALQEAVKKGIQDADPDARVLARRYFIVVFFHSQLVTMFFFQSLPRFLPTFPVSRRSLVAIFRPHLQANIARGGNVGEFVQQ